MPKITFLGGEETGDVAAVKWGDYRFVIHQPTECTDAHIVAKARGNRFFAVGDDEAPVVALDPMAKARAARAAKRAAQDDGDAA